MTKQEYYAYSSWHAMNRRCSNPAHTSFKYYGGKGIKVCEQWKLPDGFHNFLSDMGSRPPSTSLHRLDSSADYTPENCVWSANHKEKMTVADAGRKGGLARAQALSPERRSEIAKIANKASKMTDILLLT